METPEHDDLLERAHQMKKTLAEIGGEQFADIARLPAEEIAEVIKEIEDFNQIQDKTG